MNVFTYFSLSNFTYFISNSDNFVIFALMKVRIIAGMAALLISICFCGCKGTNAKADETAGDSSASRLEKSLACCKESKFDMAVEEALAALSMAEEADDRLQQARAYCVLSKIDMMTFRDSQSWENAVKAEEIARHGNFVEELCDALSLKAKLCTYANNSPADNRDDEGLALGLEAYNTAVAHNLAPQRIDACYVLSALYVNKNRWNLALVKDYYDKAGAFLEEGERIADSLSLRDLQLESLKYRMRYLRQGGRTEEAIGYCNHLIPVCADSDYFTKAQLYDHLTILYGQQGKLQESVESHQKYVINTRSYIRQKADAALQEMETKYEMQEKEREIERNRARGMVLNLALLASLLAIAVIFMLYRVIHQRNKELDAANKGKEKILSMVSQDLREDAAEYAYRMMQKGRKELVTMGLTKREIQVIRLSRSGLTSSQIAEKLHISVRTVTNHKQNIYTKMDVSSNSEMILKAEKLGII